MIITQNIQNRFYPDAVPNAVTRAGNIPRTTTKGFSPVKQK